MKATYLAAAIVAVAGMSGTAHAAFFGQAGDGDVYRIELNGTATKVSGPGGISSSSTNALGFDGTNFFRTQGAGGSDLYKNNDLFLSQVGNSFGGTVVGDNYYFVEDGTDDLHSVNLSGTATRSFVTDLSPLGDLGDIVFDGSNLLVSSKTGVITPVSLGGSVGAPITGPGNPDRFPGLAFVGSELYGVLPSLTDFVKISITGTTYSVVGPTIEITGMDAGDEIYDAATIPLPAAAWLMIGGLGAIAAYGRRARKTGDVASA